MPKASLAIPAQQFKDFLQLPADVAVHAVTVDLEKDVLLLTLEHDSFPRTPKAVEGAPEPELPVIHADYVNKPVPVFTGFHW